jgi:hypothetical protein
MNTIKDEVKIGPASERGEGTSKDHIGKLPLNLRWKRGDFFKEQE